MKTPKKLVTKGIHSKKLTTKSMHLPKGMPTPGMLSFACSPKVESTIPNFNFSRN